MKIKSIIQEGDILTSQQISALIGGSQLGNNVNQNDGCACFGGGTNINQALGCKCTGFGDNSNGGTGCSCGSYPISNNCGPH